MRSYAAGEALMEVGKPGGGLMVIVAGHVNVTRHDELRRGTTIVTHGPGGFMGELAQLAGRPALVDAHAEGPVEALIIPPDRLRALLIAEAELGERIMRALILRRMGLIEQRAGPVIVGHAENGDVLRLESFLRRNGHPYQRLNPETDAEAKALSIWKRSISASASASVSGFVLIRMSVTPKKALEAKHITIFLA